MPAFSRSVGYLGHAWCRSDSQILARNGVFVVTVACKSKTTQSELCLDEASAVCQARCEFLQCTVLGKHGAVSDDVTLRGRDVIFFLKQAKIILRCRYAPGMPRPGVSK